MNNKMQGRFIVWAKRSHELPAKLSVGANVHLHAQLSIRPKSRMFGRFDVVERPLDIHELIAVKDSMIRSQIPTLNYGYDTSMLVGNSDDEKYRSLLSFDLTSLPLELEMKRARLRLRNSFIRNSVNVSLFAIEQDWAEKDVTWSNQPRSGIKIGDYSIEPDAEEAMLDITSFFPKWLTKEIQNYGFYLIATDENESSIVQFGTRESIAPPVLEIGFYKTIYSAGLDKLSAQLIVRQHDASNLKSRIIVNSRNRIALLPSLLTIHKKKQSDMISASLTVKVLRQSSMLSKLSIETKQDKKALQGKIIVKEKVYLPSRLIIENKYGVAKLPASLRVRVSKSDDLYFSFTIKNKQRDNDLKASITVQVDDEALLSSTLTVEKKETNEILPAQLQIKSRKELSSSIEIRKKAAYSNLHASISIIGHKLLPSTLIIPWKKDLLSKLRVVHKSELAASIQVNSYFLNAQLKVQGFSESNLHSKVTVRVKRISELHARLILLNEDDGAGFGFTFII